MKPIRLQAIDYITLTSRSEKKDDFIPFYRERQNLGKLIKRERYQQLLPKIINQKQRNSNSLRRKKIYSLQQFSTKDLSLNQSFTDQLTKIYKKTDLKTSFNKMKNKYNINNFNNDNQLSVIKSTTNFTDQFVMKMKDQFDQISASSRINDSYFKQNLDCKQRNQQFLRRKSVNSLPHLRLTQKNLDLSNPPVGSYNPDSKFTERKITNNISFLKSPRFEKERTDTYDYLLEFLKLKKYGKNPTPDPIRATDESLFYNDLQKQINREVQGEHRLKYRFKLPLNDISKFEKQIDDTYTKSNIEKDQLLKRFKVKTINLVK